LAFSALSVYSLLGRNETNGKKHIHSGKRTKCKQNDPLSNIYWPLQFIFRASPSDNQKKLTSSRRATVTLKANILSPEEDVLEYSHLQDIVPLKTSPEIELQPGESSTQDCFAVQLQLAKETSEHLESELLGLKAKLEAILKEKSAADEKLKAESALRMAAEETVRLLQKEQKKRIRLHEQQILSQKEVAHDLETQLLQCEEKSKFLESELSRLTQVRQFLTHAMARPT